MERTQFQIVKLCDDAESRRDGLMGFRRLKPNECAFFIFPNASAHSFWNKNVSQNLDLACINEKFEIECFIYLEEDSPEAKYPDHRNIKYVIEMPDGAIKEHGMQEGDKVDFSLEDESLVIIPGDLPKKFRYRGGN